MTKWVATIVLISGTLAALPTTRIAARSQTKVNAPGASAAYSLDTDCADARIDGDAVVISGVRPCSTHVIIVAGEETITRLVSVTPRSEQVEALKRAGLQARGISETGSISSTYLSEPAQWETQISLARAQGDHLAAMSFSVAHGDLYSGDQRRTSLPRASIELSGPKSKLTLFDAYVDHPPLTLDGIKLRGVHYRANTWFAHAGVASLTNFRGRLIEDDMDRVFATGYSFSAGKHGNITPAIQWIKASQRFVSGRSGVVGSIQYRYDLPAKLYFVQEFASDGGLAFSSRLNYNGAKQELRMRLRSTPSHFAGLSMSPARGFQGDGNWQRELSPKVHLVISAARNALSRADGSRDSSSSADARLQWRVSNLSLSSGVGGSRITRINAQTINSVTIPAALSWDTRNFGNSIQYQFIRNNLSESSSHWLRDSIRARLGPVTITGYAGRQTQAPNVEYILGDIPWLREAILSAGASVSTIQDIQQFIAEHGDLISSGYLRDFQINLSPLHRYAGAALNWTAPRNKASLRLESRVDDDQRVGGNIVSTNHAVSLFLRPVPRSEIRVSGSRFSRRAGSSLVQAPVFSLGLYRQLGDVPDFLNRVQERGWIRGTVFADDAQLGSPANSAQGMKDVVVVLDNVRRTRTNSFGQYSFGFVPEGAHTVEIQYTSALAFTFTTSPRVETVSNTIVNFGIAAQRPRIRVSVANDAGIPIPGVKVFISGSTAEPKTTSQRGELFLEVPSTGWYSVTLDPETLPPAYSLDQRFDQSVIVRDAGIAELKFVVNALRSVSGRVTCAGERTDGSKVKVLLNGVAISESLDENGEFLLRSVPPGEHALAVRVANREVQKRVHVSEMPVNISGVELDICSSPVPARLP